MGCCYVVYYFCACTSVYSTQSCYFIYAVSYFCVYIFLWRRIMRNSMFYWTWHLNAGDILRKQERLFWIYCQSSRSLESNFNLNAEIGWRIVSNILQGRCYLCRWNLLNLINPATFVLRYFQQFSPSSSFVGLFCGSSLQISLRLHIFWCKQTPLSLEINTRQAKLRDFVEKIVKAKLGMNFPLIMHGAALLYEVGDDLDQDMVANYTANLEKVCLSR